MTLEIPEMNNEVLRTILLTLAGTVTFATLVCATEQVLLSQEELSNATYSGIYDQPVTLTDGRWEGEPFVKGGASRPSVGLVEDFRLTGDINGKGLEEEVVLLWESSGGSATNLYVAVVGKHEGKIINLGTALIGDRVDVRSWRIDDKQIVLDLVQQGPDDAICCPSQKASRVWTLGQDGLVESEAKMGGPLSLADLAGPRWHLIQLSGNDPVPEQPEVTLIFDGEQMVGNSGCNRYFVTPHEGEMPGDLTMGPIGSTRMACPTEVMQLESRYLDALGNVTRYGFITGKLALTWQKDSASKTMLFEPRTAK